MISVLPQQLQMSFTMPYLNKDDFPEIGFTPANFSKLVELTGLEPIEFMNEFGISRTGFFGYKNQDKPRTMKHKDWVDLLERVERFLN